MNKMKVSTKTINITPFAERVLIYNETIDVDVVFNNTEKKYEATAYIAYYSDLVAKESTLNDTLISICNIISAESLITSLLKRYDKINKDKLILDFFNSFKENTDVINILIKRMCDEKNYNHANLKGSNVFFTYINKLHSCIKQEYGEKAISTYSNFYLLNRKIMEFALE